MEVSAQNVIDAAGGVLHAAEYSYGHHATVNRDGGELRYTVFAYRRDHRIVAQAQSLAEAYVVAARQAK